MKSLKVVSNYLLYIASFLQDEGGLDGSDDRSGDSAVECIYPRQRTLTDSLSPQTGKSTFISMDNLLTTEAYAWSGNLRNIS